MTEAVQLTERPAFAQLTRHYEDAKELHLSTGAFKGMAVTHLLRVLGFVTMELPTTVSAETLVVEMQKVFDSLAPLEATNAVFGQYDDHRAEPGVGPGSATETFAALHAEVENWHWAGVPFPLRTGRALGQDGQQIVLGLKDPVLRVFPAPSQAQSGQASEIVFDCSDSGVISARSLVKEPGPDMRLEPAELAFYYADSFHIANGLGALPATKPYPPGSWGPAPAEGVAAPYGWSLSASEET